MISPQTGLVGTQQQGLLNSTEQFDGFTKGLPLPLPPLQPQQNKKSLTVLRTFAACSALSELPCVIGANRGRFSAWLPSWWAQRVSSVDPRSIRHLRRAICHQDRFWLSTKSQGHSPHSP